MKTLIIYWTPWIFAESNEVHFIWNIEKTPQNSPALQRYVLFDSFHKATTNCMLTKVAAKRCPVFFRPRQQNRTCWSWMSAGCELHIRWASWQKTQPESFPEPWQQMDGWTVVRSLSHAHQQNFVLLKWLQNSSKVQHLKLFSTLRYIAANISKCICLLVVKYAHSDGSKSRGQLISWGLVNNVSKDLRWTHACLPYCHVQTHTCTRRLVQLWLMVTMMTWHLAGHAHRWWTPSDSTGSLQRVGLGTEAWHLSHFLKSRMFRGKRKGSGERRGGGNKLASQINRTDVHTSSIAISQTCDHHRKNGRQEKLVQVWTWRTANRAVTAGVRSHKWEGALIWKGLLWNRGLNRTKTGRKPLSKQPINCSQSLHHLIWDINMCVTWAASEPGPYHWYNSTGGEFFVLFFTVNRENRPGYDWNSTDVCHIDFGWPGSRTGTSTSMVCACVCVFLWLWNLWFSGKTIFQQQRPLCPKCPMFQPTVYSDTQTVNRVQHVYASIDPSIHTSLNNSPICPGINHL